MKIKLIGNIQELLDGVNLLSKDYRIEIAPDGMEVEAVKSEQLSLTVSNGKAQIRYGSKAEFFRMLGKLLQNQGNPCHVTEKRQFDTCGAMIDLSHCALLNMDTLKSILRKMSVMGLNMLMMYFEESYTVPEHPYFGHMRGRYTKEELKEIDAYAEKLGIEIIPAIQTLGHLSNTLRWECFSDIKDTDDCLLVGEEKTYDFIEACIKNITECFHSKRLHIGFDETMSLGTGTYMKEHGHRPRIDIYLEHLNRVSDICKKYDKEPMIWSDMLFRLKGSTAGYDLDNAEIPAHVAERIPENVELVEANYAQTEINDVAERFQAHIRTGRKTWFAGAVQDWHGFCVHYPITFEASHAALLAAKKVGLKDVFATTWGDDSTERDYMTTLLGYQVYAEYMYQEEVDMETVMERYSFCAKVPASLILAISDIDEPVRVHETVNKDKLILDTAAGVTNPSKYFMWQDPLAGLFDSELTKLDYPKHFSTCLKEISSYEVGEEYKDMQAFYMALCETLIKKTSLAMKLRKAYSEKNEAELKIIMDKWIPELMDSLELLWQRNRKLWFIRQKAFGWDVLERRYGCLTFRLKTCIYRIQEFLEGKIDTIEELDEPRLAVIDKAEPIFFNDYLLTSTAWGR